MTVFVTGLFVYPVKSLRGIAVNDARLRRTGLRGDRWWMVLRGDGRFLTQRECPALARIATALDADGLHLSADGRPSLHLPLRPRRGPRLRTAVWGDACEVLDQGEEAGRWLDSALAPGRQGLRLVRMAPGYHRPQRHPERYGAGVTTLFADGAPLLMTSETSLDRLNTALEARGAASVTMDRFRPNVVVSGLLPFQEHAVHALRGPGYVLTPRYPCERCFVTTVDQATGAPDPGGEPWKTLRTVNAMPGERGGPAFGENAIVTAGVGARIRVGDRLAPLAPDSA